MKLKDVKVGDHVEFNGVEFTKLFEYPTFSLMYKSIPFNLDTSFASAANTEHPSRFIGSELEKSIQQFITIFVDMKNLVPVEYNDAFVSPFDGEVLYSDKKLIYGRVLTETEYRKYRNIIPKKFNPSWLMDPCSSSSNLVVEDGSIFPYSSTSRAFCNPIFWMKNDIDVYSLVNFDYIGDESLILEVLKRKEAHKEFLAKFKELLDP